MLEFKLNGDKGVCQGRIGVNSNGFLRRWTRGVSTLDLIVMEFRMGCGQMGYVVEDFRTSLGRGDAWISVPVWIYFEESTSSMRAMVLPQTVCNALVRGQRLFLTMSQICRLEGEFW